MTSIKCMRPQTASTITIVRDCNGNTTEETIGVSRPSFIARVKMHRYSKLEFFLAVISLLLLVALVVVVVVLEAEESKDSTTDNNLKKPVQAIRNLAQVLNNMDRNAHPCTDFYQYACGGWEKRNYIDDSESFLAPYLKVENENKRKLKEVLENMEIKSNHSANLAILKTFEMYSSCMNTTAMETSGDSELRKLLVKLADFNITKNRGSGYNWQNFVVKIKRRIDVDAFFKLIVMDDPYIASAKRIVMRAVQLPLNHENYAAQSFTSEAMQRRERYLQFMTDVMAMVASSGNKTLVKQKMEEVLDLETNITKTQLAPNQRNNLSLVYNPVSIEKLSNMTEKFDWFSFFRNLTFGLGYVLTPQELLVITSPKMVIDIIKLLNRADPSVISNYLAWRIVYSLIEALPSKYGKVYISYRNAQTKPRWDTCVQETSKTFPLEISLLFAQHALPKDTVSEARSIIRDIKDSFIKIIPKQSWMDEDSQKGAIEKARSIIFQLAYPENMTIDANSLTYSSSKLEVDRCYFITYLNVKSFVFMEHFKSLKAAEKRNKYIEEEPMKPTAYYYRTRNLIGISVGFLNDQLFSSDNFASVKFGILGFLTGHEISHGYDSVGHRYDKNGDRQNWMSNNSSNNIVKKTLCLKKAYSKFTYKGRQLGAVGSYRQQYCDTGGLTLALKAYKEWEHEHNEEQMLPGLDMTHNQLFFLSYAQMWCAKYQNFAVVRMVKEGSYPFPVRVRGTVMNSPEFADAFSCSRGTAMNPEEQCKVWET